MRRIDWMGPLLFLIAALVIAAWRLPQLMDYAPRAVGRAFAHFAGLP